MKLTIAQALGTILNIQVAPVHNHQLNTTEQWFVIRDPSGDQSMDVGLGRIDGPTPISLDHAVWKAAQMTSFSDEAKFVIFPINSNREDYYMAIERELLRQEATPEFSGRLMWQMLPPGDPRQLIEALMLQIRECAQAIMHPVTFQQSMLRVACLVISIMQWTSDWLGRLKVQQAAVAARTPAPPKVVEFTSPPTPDENKFSMEPGQPTVPPLFGAEGLKVVESERKDDAKPQEAPPRRKRNRNRKEPKD